MPYPGTQLWDEMTQYGRLLARDWGEFSNWHPSYLPFAYENPEQLVRIRSRILRRFHLRPRYIWGRITHIRDLEDVRRYAGALVSFLFVLFKAVSRQPSLDRLGR